MQTTEKIFLGIQEAYYCLYLMLLTHMYMMNSKFVKIQCLFQFKIYYWYLTALSTTLSLLNLVYNALQALAYFLSLSSHGFPRTMPLSSLDFFQFLKWQPSLVPMLSCWDFSSSPNLLFFYPMPPCEDPLSLFWLIPTLPSALVLEVISSRNPSPLTRSGSPVHTLITISIILTLITL